MRSMNSTLVSGVVAELRLVDARLFGVGLVDGAGLIVVAGLVDLAGLARVDAGLAGVGAVLVGGGLVIAGLVDRGLEPGSVLPLLFVRLSPGLRQIRPCTLSVPPCGGVLQQ